MAVQFSDLEATLNALKTYNQLASPTALQQTNIIKVLVQDMGRLIILMQNHPDDTP